MQCCLRVSQTVMSLTHFSSLSIQKQKERFPSSLDVYHFCIGPVWHWTEIPLTCWCLNDIFFWDLNPFSGAFSTHFGLNYWGFPSRRTHLYDPQKQKKMFCMFFGYYENFPKKKNDSGQTKCLAFRSFNEKLLWMNTMREIHWPRSLFRIWRSMVQSQIFRFPKNITRQSTRPTQPAKRPLGKRFFRGFLLE